MVPVEAWPIKMPRIRPAPPRARRPVPAGDGPRHRQRHRRRRACRLLLGLGPRSRSTGAADEAGVEGLGVVAEGGGEELRGNPPRLGLGHCDSLDFNVPHFESELDFINSTHLKMANRLTLRFREH